MKYHSKKDVNDAIIYALSKGWRLKEKGDGHTKLVLYCTNESDGEHEHCDCFINVFSTPASSSNHAKSIRRKVDKSRC